MVLPSTIKQCFYLESVLPAGILALVYVVVNTPENTEPQGASQSLLYVYSKV
jgi:hypothetical protein